QGNRPAIPRLTAPGALRVPRVPGLRVPVPVPFPVPPPGPSRVSRLPTVSPTTIRGAGRRPGSSSSTAARGRPARALLSPPSRPAGSRPAGPRRHPAPQSADPRRFRYTPTVSEPASTQVPPQAWPDDVFVPSGFEFGKLSAPDTGFPPSAHPSGPLPGPIPGQPSGRRPDGPGAGRAAGAEWAGLLRSLLPQPARRRWAREFVNGLEFRGWGIRVAIPILAMVVFGVAVVVIAGANSGHAGPAPSAASLGFPPATLAGNDFTATGSGRGITQTLGGVASVGHEIVAVGSQAGTRIPRAQFFVSGDDGRTWKLGAVRDAAGGVPPPGHGAIFVAGAQGAWVALGPGSI